MKEGFEEFLIDDEVQMYLVSPVWLSTATIAISPENRPKTLEALAKELNDGDSQAIWNLQKFQAPRTLKLRKYGQLWREFSFMNNLLDAAKDIAGHCIADRIFCRFILFDYGLCNVEVTLKLTFNEHETVDDFAKRAERLKLLFVEEFNTGLPNAVLDLNKIDSVFRNFSIKHLGGVENALRPVYDETVYSKRVSFMCGPVSRNLLLVDTCGVKPQMRISSSDIFTMANIFLNEANSDFGFTGSEKIPISHEGFEGAVALTKRDEKECMRVQEDLQKGLPFKKICISEQGNIERTKLLWSFVHLYWSALFCSSEGYYVIAASSRGREFKSTEEVLEAIKVIESYQAITSMISFESQPEKIIVEGEDSIRYAKIWEAYKSEELLKSLAQIQNVAENTLLSLRSKMEELSNRRTNSILTAFTALTMVSVIVDVIWFYDVEDSIPSLDRLSYVGSGALILAIFFTMLWVANSLIHKFELLKRD